jgi:hypothetical protein
VDEYCHKKQTPVTMQALVKTGRQKEGSIQRGTLQQRNASGKLLIQVRAWT